MSGHCPTECVYDPMAGEKHALVVDEEMRRLRCLLELVGVDETVFTGLKRKGREMLGKYWKVTEGTPKGVPQDGNLEETEEAG